MCQQMQQHGCVPGAKAHWLSLCALARACKGALACSLRPCPRMPPTRCARATPPPRTTQFSTGPPQHTPPLLLCQSARAVAAPVYLVSCGGLARVGVPCSQRRGARVDGWTRSCGCTPPCRDASEALHPHSRANHFVTSLTSPATAPSTPTKRAAAAVRAAPARGDPTSSRSGI